MTKIYYIFYFASILQVTKSILSAKATDKTYYSSSFTSFIIIPNPVFSSTLIIIHNLSLHISPEK